MKNIQKSEFAFGIASLVTALINFLINFVPTLKNATEIESREILIWSLLFLIFPTLMTAVGSYFHATRQSSLGLILVFVFGGSLALFYGGLLLTGIAFYGAKNIGAVFFGLLPGFFAAATVFYALRQDKMR